MTVDYELHTTTTDQFHRGNRVLLERAVTGGPGEQEWIIPAHTINIRELAGLAYFAIKELEPLLLSVYADHDAAASASMIQRVLDSLSWIAEELGATPQAYQKDLTDDQKEQVKRDFERIEAEHQAQNHS